MAGYLSVAQRVCIVEARIKYGTHQERTAEFRRQFPNTQAPSKRTIRHWYRAWRETGSVQDKKRERKKTVLSEEVISGISDALTRSPRKSLRRLAAHTGLSYGSAWRATKALKLRPYKISVVQELRPADPRLRIDFCQWYLQSIHDGLVDTNFFFFTDEAWFHLNGYVNTQNNRYWSSTNPHQFREVPLHDVKVGVWCAISASRVIGPIFFEDTINSNRYIEQILEPFAAELTPQERYYGYFMQDGAPAHTADRSIASIRGVFGDNVISKGPDPTRWPPRSPDLNKCDFYLWGSLKAKAYRNNPHTLEELKESIREGIAEISGEELRRVDANMLVRCQSCLNNGGNHFQHLL